MSTEISKREWICDERIYEIRGAKGGKCTFQYELAAESLKSTSEKAIVRKTADEMFGSRIGLHPGQGKRRRKSWRGIGIGRREDVKVSSIEEGGGERGTLSIFTVHKRLSGLILVFWMVSLALFFLESRGNGTCYMLNQYAWNRIYRRFSNVRV